MLPNRYEKSSAKNELKKSLHTKDWHEVNDREPKALIKLKDQIQAAELDASITLLDIKNAIKLWQDCQLAHFVDDKILAR
ncbi:hypothetical protein ELQ32_03225 [Limnobaculum zhutongyuii]|nr:hypothetical protein ELQ32_03225 [Limnobaculum zhutongyuii]